MQERGDYALVDAVTRTVGLTSSSTPGNGGLSFSSRGFAGSIPWAWPEDGMVLGVAAGTTAYPGDSWGYERIDVLRGPASLMYGSGTMGATVNAIRKQPQPHSSAEVLVGAGTDDTLRLGLGVTGALGAYASYRIDSYTARSAGERDLDQSRNGKFMSTLRLEPTSDLQIDLIADAACKSPAATGARRAWTARCGVAARPQLQRRRQRAALCDERLRAKVQWKANDWLTVRNELYHVKSDRHWRNIEATRSTPPPGRGPLRLPGNPARPGADRHRLGLRGTGLAQDRHGWEARAINLRLSNKLALMALVTVSAWDPVHGSWASPDLTAAKTRNRRDPACPVLGRCLAHQQPLAGHGRPAPRCLRLCQPLAGGRHGFQQDAGRHLRAPGPDL